MRERTSQRYLYALPHSKIRLFVFSFFVVGFSGKGKFVVYAEYDSRKGLKNGRVKTEW